MERVVKRNELQSDDTSTTPEPDTIERVRKSTAFEFVNINSPNVANLGASAADDEDLDFRLFADCKPTTTGQQAGAVHKIRLRSPSLDNTRAGFIQPERSPHCYFTKSLSDTEKHNLQSVALTGEEILARAGSFRPGSRYAWKVLNLPASSLDRSIRIREASGFQDFVSGDESTKNRRPGKKYRIKMRSRNAALKAEQDAAKAAAEIKEAAESEKRTRRNREKKIKKKLREKAKKGVPVVESVVLTPDTALDSNK